MLTKGQSIISAWVVSESTLKFSPAALYHRIEKIDNFHKYNVRSLNDGTIHFTNETYGFDVIGHNKLCTKPTEFSLFRLIFPAALPASLVFDPKKKTLV